VEDSVELVEKVILNQYHFSSVRWCSRAQFDGVVRSVTVLRSQQNRSHSI